MSCAKIFKRVLIPCAAGVTNLGTDGHTFGPNCVKKTEQGTKPSDLPIYSKECGKCEEAEQSQSQSQSQCPPTSMEETVGNIRRELWVWQDNLKGYRHKIIDVYRKGFSKADSFVDYLREPTHGLHRIGAILLSGLAGYILGMRRGKLRRLFYGTFGVLGMAAVCYPDEAADYLESVVLEGRRYFIVVYHFVCGESPKLPEWVEKWTGPLVAVEEGPKDGKSNDANLDESKELEKKESKKEKNKKA